MENPIQIKTDGGVSFLRAFKRDGSLYVFALPGVLFLLFFCYFPMAGLILVFKNYNFRGGIFGSPWAVPFFQNFLFFFNSFDRALRATRNTVFLNLLYFGVTTIVSVAIAIMLADIRRRQFVKITQSIMFFPFFISWMAFGSILQSILNYNLGTLNNIIALLGGERIDFYANANYWWAVLVICNVWNQAGYSSIIYYAAITGIDPTYYEAAMVDGASKWKQIKSITIPMLRPTVIMLFMLSLGNMLRGNLTMIVGLTNLNPALFPVTDIIDVFVYRSGIRSGELAFSSAVSLYQSVVGFILVMISNSILRRIDRENALF
ncbi:MAG: ABC transporter permease subunit [Spirochaetaceae bacterium]|jgi:putative aldouronate transport system permease protein|nr:ABC transporter permease subunit [Spirochaetaceae bacterium]